MRGGNFVEEDKVFDLMAKMYAEMQQNLKNIHTEMQNGFKGVNERIDSVESEVKKNSVLLEKQGKDIKLLAEGHKNLSEQMDRKFAEVNETIERNYTLHDRAIKNISKTSNKGEKAYDFIKELSNKNFGD